jgi:hypothetical protein
VGSGPLTASGRPFTVSRNSKELVEARCNERDLIVARSSVPQG